MASAFPAAPAAAIPEHPHVTTVRAFLHAIGAGRPAGEVLAFYHPDAEQVEFPNQLVRNGAVRDLAMLREAWARGAAVVQRQSYDLRRAIVGGDVVACEVTWRATLAIPLGTLPAGGEMVAHFAQFFEFEDGKIRRHRTYDCFEPF